MMTVSYEFKCKVLTALLSARERFDGYDSGFSKKYGINPAIFNKMKKGQVERVLADGAWINLGRELEVRADERQWHAAETDVFITIQDDVNFCKQYSKARIFVDESGIGKTFTGKYLARTGKNIFYIDASQCKSKNDFIRALGKSIGVDHAGKYADVKENLKYWIKMLPQPVIIIDEAGDLEYTAFLELKELWNATEGYCGWYMMGADGLRALIEKGIKAKKVGYRELFNRFNESYSSIVPQSKEQRLLFYKKLISDVLTANMEDTAKLESIVRSSITSEKDTGNIGGLRRAESILLLNS